MLEARYSAPRMTVACLPFHGRVAPCRAPAVMHASGVRSSRIAVPTGGTSHGAANGSIESPTGVILTAWIYASICEEVFTRGLLLLVGILGVIAGNYREKTGSLIPAILIHSFFEIGGTLPP